MSTTTRIPSIGFAVGFLLAMIALGFLGAAGIGTFTRAAEAAVGDVLQTLTLPTGAQCGTDSGSAIAIVPGGKLGFPTFPTLVVTSCQNKLFFVEPSTATLVKTITTSVTPSFGWEAITLRPDRGDILGCGIVSPGVTAFYSIDFLPSPNAVIDGTATFLRNGPAGSTCEGIAWDVSDNTIYQSSSTGQSNSKLVFHLPETGTGTTGLCPGPGCIPSGCNSLTGVTVSSSSLFVTCEGGSTINQLNKSTGALVTSFNAGTNQPGDSECDPVTFVLPQNWHPLIRNKDVIWVKNQQFAQAVAVEAPFGTCGPVPPPPLCSDGDLDTDGDGIPDCWENPKWWSDGVPGIALDGNYTLGRTDTSQRFPLCVDANGNGNFGASGSAERAAECASHLHKDIFVEIDYMPFHLPNPQSVSDVVEAFASAPVPNPLDPSFPMGIRLHVFVNEQITLHYDRIALTPCTGLAGTGDADFDDLKATWFGTAAERPPLDTTGLRLNARHWVYHYAIWAHNQAPIPPSTATNTSSGCGETPGNDFIVTMGSWSPPSTTLTGHTGGVGSRSEQAGTFLHELGHNLNLRHGGGDPRPASQVLAELNKPYVDTNCKTNYVSVMNYVYQMPNTVSDRPLNFSTQALLTLNEGNLDENQGVGLTVCPGPAPTCSIAFGPPVGFPAKPTVKSAVGAISWDLDTNATELGIKRDLNNMTTSAGACPPSAPTSTTADVLDGFNDWANIQFNFRASTDFAGGVGLTFPRHESDPPGPPQEITREQHLEITRDVCDVKSADKGNNTTTTSSPVFNATFYSRVGADPVDATKLEKSTLRLSGLDGTWILVATVAKCATGKDVNRDGLPDMSCPFDVPMGTVITPGPVLCTGTILPSTDITPPGRYFPHGYDFVGVSNVQ